MKIKLLIFALLTIGFFSCNRKTTDGWIPLTKKELKQHKPLLDSIALYNSLVDSLNKNYITVDTNNLSTTGTHLTLSVWTPKLDTSDVIVKYVSNWEEGTIETFTGKIVYIKSVFGLYKDGNTNTPKLFKVKDDIWIPFEWPNDQIELYVRPKQ